MSLTNGFAIIIVVFIRAYSACCRFGIVVISEVRRFFVIVILEIVQSDDSSLPRHDIILCDKTVVQRDDAATVMAQSSRSSCKVEPSSLLDCVVGIPFLQKPISMAFEF